MFDPRENKDPITYSILDYLAGVADTSTSDKVAFDLYGALSGKRSYIRQSWSQDIIDSLNYKNFNMGSQKANYASAEYIGYLYSKVQDGGSLTPREQADVTGLVLSMSPSKLDKAAFLSSFKLDINPQTIAGISVSSKQNYRVITGESALPKGPNYTVTDIKDNLSFEGTKNIKVWDRNENRYVNSTKSLAPVKPKLYKVVNKQTGAETFYYVLTQKTDRTIKYDKTQDTYVSKPTGNKEENNLTDDYSGGNVKIIKNKIRSVASPQTDRIKPFYSPDYKTLYTDENYRLSILLLDTPEMVLSNFNYRTIDSIPGSVSYSFYDEDGNIAVAGQEEYTPTYGFAQTQSYEIYQALNTSFYVIRDILKNTPSTSFKIVLSSYGKSDGATFIKYLPKYVDGQPEYTLEIDLPESGELNEYKYYLMSDASSEGIELTVT